MKIVRVGSSLTIVLISIAVLFGGLQQARSALGSPGILPAPHLGYGINVRHNLNLVPAGFDWIKIYEDELGGLPAGPLGDHVLLRVNAVGYPASITNYVQHVTDLVTANAARLTAIEIGNEPNMSWSWGGQPVSPENYARLLCQTRSAIKAIAPNLIVVSAGLGPVGRVPAGNPDVMDDRVFAQRMLTTMQTEFPTQYPCFDAFGFHPQGYPYPPEIDASQLPPGDNGNDFRFRATEWYRTLLVSRGLSDRPIWLTEFGYLRNPEADLWWGSNAHSTYAFCNTVPSFRDGFKWMEVSEAQQADYLVRAFQYADANWPWVGPIFVWNLDWNNRGWDCDHIKFFSVLHASSLNDGLPHAADVTLAHTALSNMPKRYAVNTPALAVQPGALTLLAEVANPTAQTRTINLTNATPNSILTWTISISTTGPVMLNALPFSGTNNAAVTVSVNLQPPATPGTYTAHLRISAEPSNTIGAPITVPVTVIAVEQLRRTYLPLISRHYTTPQPVITGTNELGLAFVSSAESPANETRYQRAQALSANLNRWPMYWPQIEKNPVSQPRVFDWSKQDANIIADINHGLTALPILMLTPIGLDTGGSLLVQPPKVGDGLRLQMQERSLSVPSVPSSQSSPPQGLYLSVFSDGSDNPGPGKTINPNNRWAYFVNAAVNRYKPGGTLAQQQGWGNDKGVRHWEIWNEEDLNFFFSGTPADFARLQKVAYLAANQADQNATIVFGGMAHFEKPNWLKDVLDIIATDPMSTTYHGFMDAVASHSYSWAWQTFGYLYEDRARLNARGFDGVKLWLTETGLPVCDDPPHVFCASPYRGSMSEQADYLIQTVAWANWLQTEKIVWFQLYDDAGNDCQYDAFGLVRNPPTGPCTARDGSPRPAYQTFNVARQNLTGVQPYWRDRRTGTTTDWANGNQEILAFKRPSTAQRVVTMWTRYYTADTVVLTATSSSALLIQPDGTSQTITPINGVYTINLPAATNLGAATPDGKQPDGTSPVGGSPRILVELDPAVQ
jgi:hypothetical protein